MLGWNLGVRVILAATVVAAATLCHVAPLIGQTSPNDRADAFEVASVQANHSVERDSGFNWSPGTLRATNVSLELLIEAAYRVRSFQIAGGPSWINAEKYDVTAKTAGDATMPQRLSMLQALLENRFNLKVHRENQELPVYVLTVAKGGLKMKPSSCTPVDPLRSGTDPKRCGQMVYGVRGSNQTISAVGIRVGALAASLSQGLARTVVDRTELTDPFDFRLEWVPDALQGRTPGDEGASIFSALQEQLGVKLEPGKGSVEVVVIDHVERLVEN
jgi:uncharacterized protein (TIGR03435 family)